MTTICDKVKARKCRVGKAAGTTRHGAYWLACDPITLRRTGGDGLGSNGPDVTYRLELRHYRSGLIQASIHRDAWHQNGSYGGGGDAWETLDSVADGQRPDGFLGCTTVEQAIVVLKRYRFGKDGGYAVYSDHFERELTAALTALGLPECEPSPDETDPASQA